MTDQRWDGQKVKKLCSTQSPEYKEIYLMFISNR